MTSQNMLMRLTHDVIVESLLGRMGWDEKNYGIQWSRTTEGEYVCAVDNIKAKLNKYADEKIYLTVSDFESGKEIYIQEPTIHISKAPIGRFLRFLTSFFLGNPYPKEPTEPKDIEKERTRIALNILYNHVVNQAIMRGEAARAEYP